MTAPDVAALLDPAWVDEDPAPIHPLLAEWGAAVRAELESEPMPEWTVDDLSALGFDWPCGKAKSLCTCGGGTYVD